MKRKITRIYANLRALSSCSRLVFSCEWMISAAPSLPNNQEPTWVAEAKIESLFFPPLSKPVVIYSPPIYDPPTKPESVKQRSKSREEGEQKNKKKDVSHMSNVIKNSRNELAMERRRDGLQRAFFSSREDERYVLLEEVHPYQTLGMIYACS